MTFDKLVERINRAIMSPGVLDDIRVLTAIAANAQALIATLDSECKGPATGVCIHQSKDQWFYIGNLRLALSELEKL